MKCNAAKLRVVGWPAFKGVNPFQYLLSTQLESMGFTVWEAAPASLISRRFDIFHVHWPEAILWGKSTIFNSLRLLGLFALVGYLKLRGTKIVWTVHNLVPHDARQDYMTRIFWRVFVRLLDGYICLTASAVPQIQGCHPSLAGIPCAVIPHGHYCDYYPNTMTRDESRQILGLPSSAKVILFLGIIKPYKNLSALVREFREILSSEYRLVIAGKVFDSRASMAEVNLCRDIAGQDERIQFHFGPLEEDQIQVFMNSADIVVLPFRSILNSGSAVLALSFNNPILVPNMGAMPELQEQFGEDWVHTFDGDLKAQDITDALALTPGGQRNSRIRETMDWAQIARRTGQFYEKVISTG